MSKDELIDRICPVDVITDCCTGEADFGCDDCKSTLENLLNEFSRQVRADAIKDVNLSLREAGYEYDENMGVGDNVGSAMLGAYAKGYNKGYEEKCLKVREDAIEKCKELVNKIFKYYRNEFNFGVTFNVMCNSIDDRLEQLKEQK